MIAARSLTVGLILLAGCQFHPQPGDAAAVYRVAIDTLFGPLRDSSRSLVVQSQTIDSRYVRLAADSTAIPKEFGALLASANARESVLTHLDSLPVPQYFLDSVAVARVVPRYCRTRTACDTAWARFHAQFPGSVGLIDLSRIAFKGSEAAVLVGGSHGYLNGEFMFVRARRVGGTWRAVQVVTLGVS